MKFLKNYFEEIKKDSMFAVPKRRNITSVIDFKKGSLAQLVQSICLTSRGSLVRTQ
jgi:hypothetical protein